jgi:hypothetical protein
VPDQKSEGGNAGSRFIDTVRKALISRVRSQSVDTNTIEKHGRVQATRSKELPISEMPGENVSEIIWVFLK